MNWTSAPAPLGHGRHAVAAVCSAVLAWGVEAARTSLADWARSRTPALPVLSRCCRKPAQKNTGFVINHAQKNTVSVTSRRRAQITSLGHVFFNQVYTVPSTPCRLLRAVYSVPGRTFIDFVVFISSRSWFSFSWNNDENNVIHGDIDFTSVTWCSHVT